MTAARAVRLGTEDSVLFVDGPYVAVTGPSRDNGAVCVTNRNRWVGDPRWGAFVVYTDAWKFGVAPLHESLLRELPPAIIAFVSGVGGTPATTWSSASRQAPSCTWQPTSIESVGS
jgi:hypothetical protein